MEEKNQVKVFSHNVEPGPEKNLKKIEIFFQYLKSFDNFELILDDQRSYKSFIYCSYTISLNELSNKIVDIIHRTKIYELFNTLLSKICSIRNELDFDKSKKKPKYDNNYYSITDKNERTIFILLALDRIFCKLFLLSLEVRRYFSVDKSKIECFITFINDGMFITKFMNFNPDWDGFVNTLQNLSVNANECKPIWKSLDSVKILLNFARAHSKWSVEAYAIIAFISTDQDIESIQEIDEITTKFIELTIKCIHYPDDDYSQQFDDEDKPVDFKVKSINLGNGFCLLIDVLLECLYGFSVNQKLKQKIYNYNNLVESVKFLFYNGIDVEKYYALRLLSQLAFSDQIKNEMLLKDTILIDSVNTTSQQETFEYKRLKSSCSNFLWILKGSQNKTKDETSGHIMLSYNTATRDLCLKIKSQLESLGFKIWIDVNDIHGSSLDSMAGAIENAQIVLMCVTEKYRQSINCQAEAQYAFRLNKTIIPLIMQQGYHNVSGWLGIIIGDKVFIDFTKYGFEDSMNRLTKQIRFCTNEPQVQVSQPVLVKSLPTNENDAKDWSEERVKDWFMDKNMESMYEIMKPLDGGVLSQMHELKKFAPEFFYKSLTSKEMIDFKIIAVFNNELAKLFENKI